MKLNVKKFFELAKENKFEACDINFAHSKKISIGVFHKEVESFSESETYSIIGRGIVNGKFGVVRTEKIDKETPSFLINGIKESAQLIETNDPSIIFKGSEKYHKKNVFNKDVLSHDISEKIELLKKIEDKLRAYDKRINEVAVIGYEEEFNEGFMSNSYGLSLKDKQAQYSFYAEITAKEKDEVKTGFKVFASIDPNAFDVDKFVKDVAEDALKKLGSTQCASKKYPVVLNQRCASLLLLSYLSNMDADEVQKKSSLFVDKLNKPIMSKKMTIVENPLDKNIFFAYHDDEGVATSKRVIVNKGELQTYLYTLETAAKDKVQPTGHGRIGAKTYAALHCIYVKPGKKSFDELISDIKEGVYITDLQGLHAGMNEKSGNFSLQAQGFMIRDGKVAEPLTLITIAGNLVEVFNQVKGLANDDELNLNACKTPSIYIKKLAISGK